MISMNDIQNAFNKGTEPFSTAIKAVKLVAKSKENVSEKEQKKVIDEIDDLTM